MVLEARAISSATGAAEEEGGGQVDELGHRLHAAGDEHRPPEGEAGGDEQQVLEAE